MILIDMWFCSGLVYKYESFKLLMKINHHWWSNTFVNFFKALLEIKKKKKKLKSLQNVHDIIW